MLRISKHKKLILAIVYLCTAALVVVICLFRKDKQGLDPFLWAMLFPLAGLAFDIYLAFINFRIEVEKSPLTNRLQSAMLKAIIGLAMLILLLLPVDFASKGIVNAIGVKAPDTEVRLEKLEFIDEKTSLSDLDLPPVQKRQQPYIETAHYRSSMILMMLIWASLFLALDAISMSSKNKKSV